MPRASSRRPASSSSRPSAFSSSGSSRPASTAAAPSTGSSWFSRSTPAAAPTRTAPPAPAPAAAAAPVAAAAPAAAAPQQPGLFAQMASTAAGVAVGSAVGHTVGAGLTGMFSGSSNDAPAQQQQAAPPAVQAQGLQQQQGVGACDVDARNFTKCLEDTNGNMQACDFYLQQLKACQAAAKPY
ncbi:unnamed protein product [Ambrosiozyma monospora]|uniref:Unnamed protein product n=1 Tax=Ambrosiozyma monospora TaxID=43982 RepID=A0ACB5TA25_AMBMO|nr:unnamed protein product [Ambrosiozyma monospora]